MSFILEIRDYCGWVFRYPKMKRILLTVFVFWGVDLVLVLFFWGPSALSHHQLKSRIEEYRRLKLEVLKEQSAAENYGRMTRTLAKLEAKWKNQANQSSLIQSLTRLASKTKLKVVSQDFDVLDSKAGKIFKQTLSLTGTYAEIRSFLSGLEGLPSLTVVEQTKLERSGGEGNRLRATFGLFTFNKPPGKRL